MRKQLIAVAAGALVVTAWPTPANAADSTVYEQDFTVDADGWFDSDDAWAGTVTHNPGADTATMEGDDVSAPFSRFDGYRSEWPGAWVAELDVYLDPAWPAGTGFDYSVAAQGTDGDHHRDFIFHVAVDEDGLWVGASNNSGREPRSRTTPHSAIAEPGWYTLQHVFAEEDGVLAVTLDVVHGDGTTVFSTVRSTAADTIPDVVGGNRYAWFTYVSVPGGVEVDNHALTLRLPEPASMRDCKDGGYAEYGYDNQGLCIASVVAGP